MEPLEIKKFHPIILLVIGVFQMNRNREFSCLQAGNGLSEIERGQKAIPKKVFEIHTLLR
jgi:hypothetical protein